MDCMMCGNEHSRTYMCQPCFKVWCSNYGIDLLWKRNKSMGAEECICRIIIENGSTLEEYRIINALTRL